MKTEQTSDYGELREFVRRITLELQQHRSRTPKQLDGLFQEAYKLYVKHDVEQPLSAGMADPADAIKSEAVQRGFATWVADEYGNTTFTWKEPTQ